MIKINKFKDTISGLCFDTEIEAIESEKKHKDIQDTFAFYDKTKTDSCAFVNGEHSIKRNEEFYSKLIDGIINMVNKYESWILKSYKNGLTKENVRGYTILGRFLGDGDSSLYEWWSIQANICPRCFREWGQLYHANHCPC